jgi:hypothetical protein
MAIQTAAMRDLVANAYHTNAAFGALGQTDTTVTTFPNEISGGAPAYARKALTWSAGNGGSASATFDVASGITITKAGVYSAVTAGTYYDGAAVTSQNFASQGTYAATFTFTVT